MLPSTPTNGDRSPAFVSIGRSGRQRRKACRRWPTALAGAGRSIPDTSCYAFPRGSSPTPRVDDAQSLFIAAGRACTQSVSEQAQAAAGPYADS